MTFRGGPAAFATIVGLLGCGPAIVPRADYVRRANAICAATAARIARLATPSLAVATHPEAQAGYVDAYVAELRQELDELRAIGYPSGQRAAAKRAYRAVEAALAAVERDPASFTPRALAPATGSLRQLGLTACRP